MRFRKLLVGIPSLVLVIGGVISFVMQPLVRPIESRDVHIDTAALERHVRMLAVTLYPRSVDNLLNLERAAD